MTVNFHKYHGTGNDFILIDNRSGDFPKDNVALIQNLCDRRFGIGGDGLILLENHSSLDFEMVYFNSDGNIGSMCGNGGRCIVAFASMLEIIKNETKFMAPDGVHSAFIENDLVTLNMSDVAQLVHLENGDIQVETGSPHYVKIVKEIDNEFVQKASAIRNNSDYKREGINVNFMVINPTSVTMRTFERGVEDETFSCGTGAVAAALAAIEHGVQSPVSINTKGGNLQVFATTIGKGFEHIKLKGPAEMVFYGSFNI